MVRVSVGLSSLGLCMHAHACASKLIARHPAQNRCSTTPMRPSQTLNRKSIERQRLVTSLACFLVRVMRTCQELPVRTHRQSNVSRLAANFEDAARLRDLIKEVHACVRPAVPCSSLLSRSALLPPVSFCAPYPLTCEDAM